MISENKYTQAQRKEVKKGKKGTNVRFCEWRKRKSIKIKIIKLYDELESLPEAQLNKIFLDEYVEKILKMEEIALSSAKWKPGKAEIKILRLKKIRNLKTKKFEQRWITPFDMEVTKEGELITKFDNIKMTNPNREYIFQDHLTKLSKYYFTATEIKEHNQLKYMYGRPSNATRRLREMNSDLHSAERENKNLLDFIQKEGLKEKYDSEENQKYDDETIRIMKKI